MNAAPLTIIDPSDAISRRCGAFDDMTLSQARQIVENVRQGGEAALREYAVRLDGLTEGEPLVIQRDELNAALQETPDDARQLLIRTAERIRTFADAQRACLTDLVVEIPGGQAGHTVKPLDTAGCYAPGGRYPLVSSMLMTVVTARAAGVKHVWAASPNPNPLMLAAAAVSGADALLRVGGAHAIAALAFGLASSPKCDVIVGPGNRWVTAAKQVVSNKLRVDMLAGPSELLVLADDTGDPRLIAADLLAQAEHDEDARPMLVSTSRCLIDKVNIELTRQLQVLPTRETATAALSGGFATLTTGIDDAIALCNQIAPEHFELHVHDAVNIAKRIRDCGALFVGSQSAEVLGDYSAGPNHTLPTGGSARHTSGLSVFTFLRQNTWIRMDSLSHAGGLYADAAALARLEGLSAHAISAEMRLKAT